MASEGKFDRIAPLGRLHFCSRFTADTETAHKIMLAGAM
jgi:hypothetical protein